MSESVKVGQVWIDNDPRMRVRRLKVVRVSENYAWCVTERYRHDWSGRQIRIALKRFRPTSRGYRLDA